MSHSENRSLTKMQPITLTSMLSLGGFLTYNEDPQTNITQDKNMIIAAAPNANG